MTHFLWVYGGWIICAILWPWIILSWYRIRKERSRLARNELARQLADAEWEAEKLRLSADARERLRVAVERKL